MTDESDLFVLSLDSSAGLPVEDIFGELYLGRTRQWQEGSPQTTIITIKQIRSKLM